MLAGIVRVPLTSVFMIFELTRDYSIMVPVMISNLVSFAFSRNFSPSQPRNPLLFRTGFTFRGRRESGIGHRGVPCQATGCAGLERYGATSQTALQMRPDVSRRECGHGCGIHRDDV